MNQPRSPAWQSRPRDAEAGLVTEGATYDQRRLAGRAVRARVPRSAHEAWQPPDDRPDPIELLAENNLPRLPDLVPVRYGRMLASPFAFLRGSAVIMASDLASTPVTGLRVQACGDAHLGNFGVFAMPERNLVFDVNDFDETLPGPWEWDLKRLAVSVIVAAGNLQIDAGQAAAFTTATIRAYRERMAELAVMGPLDAWYDRIDAAAVLTLARQRRAKDLQRQLSPAKLRHRTSLHVLPKLTSVVNGTRKIIDDPPLIGHFDPEAFDGQEMIAAYAESLPPDRRPLLERYHVLDTARKVVGVGSVGTRCYLSLLTDADARSPIFLQLKEAMEAVLAPYSGKSEFAHAGQRVVVGQRLMQAASDMFLGWTSYRGHHYYVRQFRDMKGSVNLDAMTPSGFASYAEVCGRTLARAHARSGDAATIAGYTGTGTRFDASITAFAQAYGEQVRRDYDALVVAIESGRITVARGLLAAPPRGGPGRVVPVQGLHQLLLGVAGQRRLEHRAAVGAQCLDELVRGDLAHDDHEGRRSRPHQVLDALLEVVLDAEVPGGAQCRPHDPASHPGQRRQRKHEQQPDQRPPEQAADRTLGHRVVRAW